MKFQDAETLSAYLDGQLSTVEIARLEARLAVDSGLRQVLNDLRVA
jgi:anti-sigma factor RsiW